MADPKHENAAALDSTQPHRKTGNLLSLALAAYREGDVDTAFDLFISGMESHLTDGETAKVGGNFASLIEEALREARSVTDDALAAGDDPAEAHFEFPLDEAGLLADLDEIRLPVEGDNDTEESALGNLADLDAVA